MPAYLTLVLPTEEHFSVSWALPQDMHHTTLFPHPTNHALSGVPVGGYRFLAKDCLRSSSPLSTLKRLAGTGVLSRKGRPRLEFGTSLALTAAMADLI